MTGRTYSEADVQRIVDEALARQAAANSPDPLRAELALARVTKDNNLLDQLRVQRMTADERRHVVRDEDLVREAMADIQPILDARIAVELARKAKEPIAPELLALSRQDETQFDTQEIECLAEQVHIGDGRKIHQGQLVKCHPAFAEILAGRGLVRLIGESDETAESRSAVVTPLRDVSRR